MSSRNRARTRAIRAEMVKTGENYTRSATAVGKQSTKSIADLRTDVVKEHIRRVLEANRRGDDTKLERAEELERSGRRIVNGGQISGDSWEITDWRTGELIAEGSDGLTGYDLTADRLDPNGTWFHADHLSGDEPEPYVATPGMPPSLGQAIEEWVDMLSTPDEEIAEFIGWPVEKVREYR